MNYDGQAAPFSLNALLFLGDIPTKAGNCGLADGNNVSENSMAVHSRRPSSDLLGYGLG
jgi:hypothetical protein